MMHVSSDHLDAYLMQTWMTNISMIMVLDLDTIICANVQIFIYDAANFVTNQPTNKGILGVGLESYTFLHFSCLVETPHLPPPNKICWSVTPELRHRGSQATATKFI